MQPEQNQNQQTNTVSQPEQPPAGMPQQNQPQATQHSVNTSGHQSAQQQPAASPNSAGIIVLQWLTYAFWGWTILAMSILTGLVYTSFLTDNDIGGSTPYSIASVLVLLPIAVVCESLYRKKEPAKKTGAASIVMVIHAVIFALFGIGAVITAVFFLVGMFTNATFSDGQKVGLLTALTVAVFYGITFLRTLNPARIKNLPKIYMITMVAIVGIIALMGIIGPVAKERRTRNDRLISSNINTVTQEISDYANKNDRLPDSLDQLDLKDDAKALVEKGLLKYTPNTKQPERPYQNSTTGPRSYTNSYSQRTVYYYELCATFAESKEDRYNYGSYREDKDGYQSSISTYYGYEAGENCWKVKTTDY